MVCSHLKDLESAIIDAGIPETYRGAPWSRNCREWVYFDCVLELTELRERFNLAECVKDHDHRGTHDGSERGFYCSSCHDAIMGVHPGTASRPVFR